MSEGPPPKCPICGKPADKTYRPFCSRRCADVDLNRWLGGQYAIPASEGPELEDEPDGPDDTGANAATGSRNGRH
jgi:endogenous inhibitor of DNA gyrase (YacG/DUF329 family)